MNTTECYYYVLLSQHIVWYPLWIITPGRIILLAMETRRDDWQAKQERLRYEGE